MAELFHSELSLHDAIESRSKAIYYSYRATDTLNAIYDFARLAATYVLLNNNGKAEDVLLQVRDYYMRHNMVKEWARESVPLIYMYLRMPERLHDAKELIDAFETESGLMTDGTMLSQVEFLLFKFKGQYYEQLNMLDSAEAFFRKLQHPRMEWTQKDPMYHGLTNIFRKRNIPDSVAKYALLYGEANDSSIAIKDRELITKMAALFNYSRVQDFAVKKELEAERNHSKLIVILSVSALLLSLLLSLSFSLWKRRVQLKKEHNRLLEEYVTTKLQHEKRLDEQQHIIRLKEKNIQSLDRASARLKMELYTKGEQYHQALLQIKETKAEYETYTNNLKAEIQRLNMKLDELKEQDYLKVCMEKAMLFRSKAIVQKVERIAREQTGVIEDNDWDMLSRVFTESYPKLMKDLRDASKIHRREIRVCMLTALGIAPSRIAALLGIKNNLVSRSKNYINMELFGDQDTASLFTNLELRYGLFS